MLFLRLDDVKVGIMNNNKNGEDILFAVFCFKSAFNKQIQAAGMHLIRLGIILFTERNTGPAAHRGCGLPVADVAIRQQHRPSRQARPGGHDLRL